MRSLERAASHNDDGEMHLDFGTAELLYMSAPREELVGGKYKCMLRDRYRCVCVHKYACMYVRV
jgi:hypothetical protein